MSYLKLSLIAALSLALFSCTAVQHRQSMTQPLIGVLSRQQIEQNFPDFIPSKHKNHDGLKPKPVKSLSDVPPGGLVTIYLGTWCGDSKRELSRFWQALESLGTKPPFDIRYIGVDRQKQAPGLLPDADLRFVPTFVVSRDGKEIGRVVESAPQGIDVELRALLMGEKQGTISGRDDL